MIYLSVNANAVMSQNATKKISIGMIQIVSVVIDKSVTILSWPVCGREICSGTMTTVNVF